MGGSIIRARFVDGFSPGVSRAIFCYRLFLRPNRFSESGWFDRRYQKKIEKCLTLNRNRRVYDEIFMEKV